MGTDMKPADIAKRGIAKAKKDKVDYVIVDTSGRLQARIETYECYDPTGKTCATQQTSSS